MIDLLSGYFPKMKIVLGGQKYICEAERVD